MRFSQNMISGSSYSLQIIALLLIEIKLRNFQGMDNFWCSMTWLFPFCYTAFCRKQNKKMCFFLMWPPSPIFSNFLTVMSQYFAYVLHQYELFWCNNELYFRILCSSTNVIILSEATPRLKANIFKKFLQFLVANILQHMHAKFQANISCFSAVITKM